MRYVLDTSVALQWVLNEPSSPKARQLRDDFRKNVHEPIAPDTFVVEAAHALTKAERQKVIQVGDAEVLLADILSTPPQLFPFLPLVARAVEISSKMRVGVYDCLFVALAEREGLDLITVDMKLVSNLKGFPIVELSQLP
jgi:predicted nucleic acid-binding protein